ncbi:MAG: MBL fold metallo-hydrolase, partial [Planctomycetes bacterium]|nr:MBL fold metallo-hydrolase [Planctomycetota bacterium]
MRIKFWGTRGSIPTPGPTTVKYGGNTPCVEVLAGRTRVVIDAGTGIREMGRAIARSGEAAPEVHLLI